MGQWIVSLPDRLDSFLAASGRMLSRAKAQKAIEEGQVKVNDGIVTKTAHRVQEGDKVTLDAPPLTEAEQSVVTPTDLSLTILYEDDACFVIQKPAGYAVHPGAGMAKNEPTILHGIAFLYKKRKIPFTAESVLVHRLDKDTTGCLLIAKTPAAHLFLQEQFESRTVKKLYLAIVAGIPKLPEATVDAPIGRNVSNRMQMSVYHTTGDAREAQTTYRVLATAAGTGAGSEKKSSLLECDLHTGRTHQVRVHLSSIGHPVLGDDSYTSSLGERLAQEFAITSLCLHAWKLTFVSPEDQKEHPIVAPLPQSFLRALQAAGIEWKGR